MEIQVFRTMSSISDLCYNNSKTYRTVKNNSLASHTCVIILKIEMSPMIQYGHK